MSFVYLGHDKSGTVTNDTANTCNGHSAKTLKSNFGVLPLDIPRDRQGSFEPKIVDKHLSIPSKKATAQVKTRLKTSVPCGPSGCSWHANIAA